MIRALVLLLFLAPAVVWAQSTVPPGALRVQSSAAACTSATCPTFGTRCGRAYAVTDAAGRMHAYRAPPQCPGTAESVRCHPLAPGWTVVDITAPPSAAYSCWLLDVASAIDVSDDRVPWRGFTAPEQVGFILALVALSFFGYSVGARDA